MYAFCLQAECPLYVHKRVWADHKSQAREVIQGDDETARFLLGQAKEPEDLSGTNAFTTIRYFLVCAPHEEVCCLLQLHVQSLMLCCLSAPNMMTLQASTKEFCLAINSPVHILPNFIGNFVTLQE